MVNNSSNLQPPFFSGETFKNKNSNDIKSRYSREGTFLIGEPNQRHQFLATPATLESKQIGNQFNEYRRKRSMNINPRTILNERQKLINLLDNPNSFLEIWIV